jgi:hypothetical protein
MGRREETLFGCEFVDHARDGALEGPRRGHVDYLAAARAQEVMVVMQEVLGHLESGELVARGDPSHDAGSLEV